MRKLSRISASLVAILALFLGSLLMAAPAHAASACKTTTKVFELDWEADVQVNVKLCIESSGGEVFTHAEISWDAGWTSDPAGRFEYFQLDLRLEKYVNGADTIRGRVTCDVSRAINSEQDGWEYCSGPNGTKSGSGYSSDGTVHYQPVGGSPSSWQLTGTPRI
jgi:hypothetical protein